MSLERRSASQVCTLAPQRTAWSAQVIGSGIAGWWAFAYAGYSYIAVTPAAAALVAPGDVFRLFSGANLKEPALFTVAAISAIGFGVQNLYFAPAPQVQPAFGDTATSLPRPSQPRWLGAIGHVSGLTFDFTCPGGPSTMSCLLRLPPDYRTSALNPGRVVQVWRGANVMWEGKLNEPSPGTGGWTVTAHGSGTYGADFAATYTTWGADDPVNQAIARGLRWSNPGIGAPLGIWTAQQQDSGSQTVSAHMNLLCTGGALLWMVLRPGTSAVPAPPWALSVFPFRSDGNGMPLAPPTRILIAHSPVARSITADINTMILRYQVTADVPATATRPAVAATFATTTVANAASVAQHGPMEFFADLSSAGVLTAAAAQAVGSNVLSRYVRASFAGSFTVRPGEVLNSGGAEVDLATEQAGEVYQLMVSDGAYGGEVAPAPLVFMSGTYAYDEDSVTATITPFQGVREDITSLLSALYPGRF